MTDQQLFSTPPTPVTAEPETVGTVMAYICSYASDRGADVLTKRWRNQMVNEIQLLIREGVSPLLIKQAGEIVVVRGLDPSRLATCVVTAQTAPDRATNTEENELLRSFLAEHEIRWPTGVRMIRGTHGADYVPDSLGIDVAPYVVPWGKPTRAEVIAALLRRRDGRGSHNQPPDGD